LTNRRIECGGAVELSAHFQYKKERGILKIRTQKEYETAKQLEIIMENKKMSTEKFESIIEILESKTEHLEQVT
jgi:hypothetical protein